MEYITVKQAALKWKVTERMVRAYCIEGRIKDAVQEDKTWLIPAETKKPKGKQRRNTAHKEIVLSSMAKRIKYEREKNNHYGIYEYVQVNLTYSSNRMASNRLTREQVMELFRTNKISGGFEPMKVDDMIEAINHFTCVRMIVDLLEEPLTQEMIKRLHTTLFYGTFADRNSAVRPGHYRSSRGKYGVFPSFINQELTNLIAEYENTEEITFERILDFHARFEAIQPFEDGNGRIGRLLLLKECLRFGHCPLIIDDKRRGAYNKGIAMWGKDRSGLMQVCLETQEYFQSKYELIKLMDYSRPPAGRGARK